MPVRVIAQRGQDHLLVDAARIHPFHARCGLVRRRREGARRNRGSRRLAALQEILIALAHEFGHQCERVRAHRRGNGTEQVADHDVEELLRGRHLRQLGRERRVGLLEPVDRLVEVAVDVDDAHEFLQGGELPVGRGGCMPPFIRSGR
ncbi:MAG: hypothetical protein IPM40_01305 [Gammaproteobacteria bacterium]|nr:hypothetical protein [Gammaproteobacteria bacterium]